MMFCKTRSLSACMLALMACDFLCASVQFLNNNAAFVLTSANASIKLNPTSVSGWASRSIIKRVTGAGLGDYNIKSYDANSDGIVSFSEAPADLLYSNSNAIMRLSNDVRTNSNAIVLLDANADAFDVTLRTYSNALLYGD